MNINTNSVANGQGSSVSTSSDQKITRARSMDSEGLRACAKELVPELNKIPEDKSFISLKFICDKFNCVRSVALEVLNLANKDVRRYYEVIEDLGDSSLKRVRLSSKGAMTGFTYFDRANKNVNRPENKKFVLGDEFDVEFPEDDWDTVIYTRVRPASTTDDTVEA